MSPKYPYNNLDFRGSNWISPTILNLINFYFILPFQTKLMPINRHFLNLLDFPISFLFPWLPNKPKERNRHPISTLFSSPLFNVSAYI
ncbi:hypothetical protein EUGRSUZ_G00202 [Eucalyptus grandis]|uniref:Uncharacterized protein n=2 Tax=Eucalyptus grandis TaxID=71139 RepID=A0A059B9T1_EUCGR|nr:hypothetical protein EUGRSUZ_G00202 [Eucalyptus grandis]